MIVPFNVCDLTGKMAVKPKSKMSVHINTGYVIQFPKSRNNYGINKNIPQKSLMNSRLSPQKLTIRNITAVNTNLRLNVPGSEQSIPLNLKEKTRNISFM